MVPRPGSGFSRAKSPATLRSVHFSCQQQLDHPWPSLSSLGTRRHFPLLRSLSHCHDNCARPAMLTAHRTLTLLEMSTL